MADNSKFEDVSSRFDGISFLTRFETGEVTNEQLVWIDPLLWFDALLFAVRQAPVF